MASTIYAVTGLWKSWTPNPATGTSTAEYLGEQRLYWGAPAAGSQAYIGFTGVAPPALDAEIGSSYALGTVRLSNAEVLGTAVQRCVLEITVRFLAIDGPTYAFELNLSLARVGSTVVVVLDETLPLAIATDDLRLSCTGFAGDTTTELNAVSSSGLLFTLLGTPFEDENCGSFTPFFHPDGCDVPAVCPISDDPIIEDCSIPDAIEPIFDCQDIDLPIGSHYGWAGDAGGGGGGGGGGDGGQGPPGEDGEDACKPRFTVAYEVRWVRYRWEVGVTVETFECPTTTGAPGAQADCCYQLVFTFYLLTDPLYDLACCPFLYCSGVWVPQNDELCAGVDPPVAVGEPGQLFYKCDCDATTTTQAPTTTPAPTWPCHTTNLQWGILLCNSNASRDDDDLNVFMNGVDMNVAADFDSDTCQSLLILDTKFVALEDPVNIDALIRQLHLPEFDSNGALCECVSPEIAYGPLDANITTGLNELQLFVDEPFSPSYGRVYLFRFDADEDGNMRLCCVLVNSTYLRPPGNVDGDSYTLPYPFMPDGPCSDALTTEP